MFCSTAMVAPFRQNIFFSLNWRKVARQPISMLRSFERKFVFVHLQSRKRRIVPDLRWIETCSEPLLQSKSGAWQRLKTSDPLFPIAWAWVKSSIKTHHAWVDPWKHRLRSWLSLSSRSFPRRWVEGQCSIDWHDHYMSGWLCQGTSGKFFNVAIKHCDGYSSTDRLFWFFLLNQESFLASVK